MSKTTTEDMIVNEIIDVVGRDKKEKEKSKSSSSSSSSKSASKVIVDVNVSFFRRFLIIQGFFFGCFFLNRV